MGKKVSKNPNKKPYIRHNLQKKQKLEDIIYCSYLRELGKSAILIIIISSQLVRQFKH